MAVSTRLLVSLAFALSICGNACAAERLIWNARIDDRWTVMTRDADGSTREWLPPSAGDVWAWSRIDQELLLLARPQRQPDVDKSNADRRWRLHVTAPDGEMRRLSELPVSDGMPTCMSGAKACLAGVMEDAWRRIVAIDAGSDGVRHPVGAGPWHDADPQYAPDGMQLLFRSDRSGSWELWLMRLPEGPFRQLTRDDANNSVPRHEYGGEGPARFSPDGRHIVWMRRFPDRGYDIWRMDLTTGAMRNLTADSPGDDAYPAFSADGRRIAFDSDRSGDNEIYTMSADGGDIERITHRDGADLAPLWIATPEKGDEG